MSKIQESKNITRLSKLILFCILLSLCRYGFFSDKGWANQPDEYPSTPEGVVQKFCKLDDEGKRLASDTWGSIVPFVTWPEEAGDMIFVIAGFKVGRATIADTTAKVPVEYKVLGSTDFIEFLEATQKRATPYVYNLIKQIGKWKIQGPVSAPHVHWETAIAHLKEIQRSEPVRKEQLELIIQKIMKAKERVK